VHIRHEEIESFYERFDVRPARAAMRGWLDSDAVVLADGAVLSWVSGSNPGFPYPEAAAIWLAWAAWRSYRSEAGANEARVEAVAFKLLEELRAGPIGKAEYSYLFDTCLAVSALSGWVGDLLDAKTVKDVGLMALEPFVRSGQPVLPSPKDPHRWSCNWGMHLLKTKALLELATIKLNEPRFSAVTSLIGLHGDKVLPDYMHARAYGLEGLIMAGKDVRASVSDLTKWQSQKGAMYGWADKASPGRADVTAQAVCLWSRRPFDGANLAITKGLYALRSLQSEAGGLFYEESSDHINTWATAFADQAMAWGQLRLEGKTVDDEPWI